jgi:hypothetical protein
VPLLGTSSADPNPLPWHCLFQAVAHGSGKFGLLPALCAETPHAERIISLGFTRSVETRGIAR